ncbi:MAG: rna polymerase sigma factor region 2 [Verrucomicrobiales bacterium]|nr:rna polymerase sigma factor region 2 [Verrucomicrobiales bacterium]
MKQTKRVLMSKEELIPTRWSLIQRLKSWDDQESWKDFFETYWRLIYGVALKSGLTNSEAEDVVQDTVISVSKKIGDFKADPAAGSFKGWLMQLTRWRIIDQIRKRSPEVPYLRQNQTERTPETAQIPDPAGLDLEKIWEEEWNTNLLKAALEKVQAQANARHYQVFYLHVIQEVPPDKVAAITGVSAEQVYVIKHRLTPLFRTALKQVEDLTSGR